MTMNLFQLAVVLCCLLKLTESALSNGISNAQNVQVDLEPINNTLNYRIYGKKGRDEKPWFDSRGMDMRHIQCVRQGRCEKLTTINTCLGANISYEYTSLDLTDYQSQEHVAERLRNYQALRYVPKCWAVIQPFLCAVFVPKCEQINNRDMVYLPSLEMCRITMEPCRILYNTSYFPEFMRCNETLFPSKCKNDVREMKFNASGSCLPPLVPAESSASYFPGIEGCGIRCKDPLYTDDEHRQIKKLIAWGGSLCLLTNLFVVATFIIDWENANKYPALIVFYINVCFLFVSVGWLAQFTQGSHDDIVCRKDGTLRHSEPTAGENLSCVIIFILVYYFLVAAMVWFVFLTYAWHLRAVGNVQDRIDKKGSYFHLVAWSLPLVLTITTMALSEVDGNSTVGICFVGYQNHRVRAGLLLGPLCGVILVGGYFIIRGMIMLFGLKHFANDIKSTSASNKIHLIIVRMGLCAVFTVVFILVAIACHVSEFRHSQQWVESLRKSIICLISSTYTDEHFANSKCKLESRPSVALLQLHLLCLFGAGIVMSTWCWTPSSIDTWKRFIRRKCGKEVIEEVKMPKHKVIAQTWAKRKEFEDKGRLSITLYNTHTDPVGLNFDVNDLNSSETNEISSTWANYLPQFVKRRMALTGATTAAGNTNSSSQGPRKSSLDSEISFSVRHVSVESRRNSVDSQVSVKIAEMKTKVAARSRSGHHHGNHNHHHHHHHQHHQQHNKHSLNASNKRSQRRRDYLAATVGRKHNSTDYANGRRESSTSIESQMIALKKTSYPSAGSHKVNLFAQSTKRHNTLKRRSANAGLNPAEISEFLARNSILPLHGMTTSTDEDEEAQETWRASYKVQDSILDVVLNKQDLSDDNDEDDNNDYQHHNFSGIAHDDDYTSNAQIEELLDESASRNAKKQIALENLLKTMQRSNESTKDHQQHQRHSRNSTRSRQSSRKSNVTTAVVPVGNMNHNNGSINRRSKRKSMNSRKSRSTVTANRSNEKQMEVYEDLSDSEFKKSRHLNHINNSMSTYSSAELDIPLAVMLDNSYSGISLGNKPNSRNSKTSCDVGIQANAHEIANFSLNSHGNGETLELEQKRLNANNRQRIENSTTFNGFNANEHRKNNQNLDTNNRNIDDDGDDNSGGMEATEMHSLLNGGQCVNNGTMKNQRKPKEPQLMSESERLKMLLLPSK